ncbi:uncharacterized protein PRD47_016252 isoform 1-T1 [Ara ararauna]
MAWSCENKGSSEQRQECQPCFSLPVSILHPFTATRGRKRQPQSFDTILTPLLVPRSCTLRLPSLGSLRASDVSHHQHCFMTACISTPRSPLSRGRQCNCLNTVPPCHTNVK